MRTILKTLVLTAAISLPGIGISHAGDHQAKPTVVLVHGAFAGSSGWDGVIEKLESDGYTAIAAANPLRGVKTDGAAVSSVLRSISGPIILVGHSYGGPVITEAANGNPNVKALVYVAAFAPDTGESSASLSDKFPGSTLAGTLTTTTLPGGGRDLYIRLDRFHDQFAADVSEKEARLMAATQRPVAEAALAELTGKPSWKIVPSYAIYGSKDLCIPPAVMNFMAKRSHAVKTEVIDGASHALIVSHANEVAAFIEDAALAQ
jgi:pimeloyl-ACP methyl ester carboxylesterase